MADRAALKALASQREAIEHEMGALVDSLNAPGQPGLKGNLVDAEGFPRADVDVHAVRTARHRLAVLKTDCEAVTAQLEKGLRTCFPAASGSQQGLATPPPAGREPPKRARLDDESRAHAWAVIDEVSAGSPAHAAGLCVGDEVLSLGTATALADAPAVVSAAAGAQGTVMVVVRRAGTVVNVPLAPRQWSGRGVLGCHLRPK